MSCAPGEQITCFHDRYGESRQDGFEPLAAWQCCGTNAALLKVSRVDREIASRILLHCKKSLESQVFK